MLTSESSDDWIFRSSHSMEAGWLRSPHEGSHVSGDAGGGEEEERLMEPGCKQSEKLTL